jgi:hypothetical protein
MSLQDREHWGFHRDPDLDEQVEFFPNVDSDRFL